jgi:predicted nucleic acid-binding Zn ribbon protein
MTDIPLKECPVCGGELQKVISGGIGIIFKGSGFYTTDSKRSSATATGSISSPASSGAKEGATADGGKDGAQNAGKSKEEAPRKDEKKSVETANS